MSNEEQLEVIQQLRNGLKKYLDLDDAHCYIYNNKWQKINDKNLYVVIGIDSEEVLANNLNYTRTEEELISHSSVLIETNFFIDFFSYNLEARRRRFEVLSYLSSDECEFMSEQKAYRVYRIPHAFRDLSTEEGNKILNRFRIDFKVHHSQEFTKSSPYYDKLGGKKVSFNN